MAGEPSKTQIDKLGERLKEGNITEDDLRLLDEYRRSFSGAYETVVAAIRDQLDLDPTGRPSKSTTSISEKLRRESIRLSQIQDISGCRLVVSEVARQDQVVESLAKVFENVTVVDRRKQPSYGYRAVHMIVKTGDKLVEIQVRTALQHLWAEMSEKLSDILDPAIKYGGGDQRIQEFLTLSSDGVGTQEDFEARARDVHTRLEALLIPVSDKTAVKEIVRELQDSLDDLQRKLMNNRENLARVLQKAIDLAAKQNWRKP